MRIVTLCISKSNEKWEPQTMDCPMPYHGMRSRWLEGGDDDFHWHILELLIQRNIASL